MNQQKINNIPVSPSVSGSIVTSDGDDASVVVSTLLLLLPPPLDRRTVGWYTSHICNYGTSSLSSSRVHTTHPVYFPSMEPSRRLIEMVSRVCSIHYSLYFYLRALESRKFNADSKVCCCCCCCCYSLFSFLFFFFLFFLFHEPNHHLSKSTATITSQPPPPPSSSTPDTSTTRVRIILSSVSSVSIGARLIHHRCAATEEHGGVRSFSLLWTMLFLVATDL